MGLKGKLVGEMEVKSSADLFHEMFKTTPHKVSTIAPNHIQNFELHDGEVGKSGAIICWNYSIGGKGYTAKQTFEVDEVNKILTFKSIGGEVLNEFKSYVAYLHVQAEGNGYDKVTWTIDYEKHSEEGRFPTQELDFLLQMSKDIENHHALTS